ncbi:MAG: nuclear transport factor 2 family protein [Actinobacteria bacterium]|nr:nuclear transport factor 2 family protein [Actinomycetota bacterium]
MQQDHIERTVDHVAIDRLLRSYADVLDRRAWTELPGLFAPDATVELDLVTSPVRTIDGPELLAEFIAGAVARFSFFEFMVLNAHIELWPNGDRDAATARVFMCELRQEVASGERSDAYGLYRDRYVRTADGWRFAHRRYRSMARFPAGDVFPLPHLDG